MKVSYPGETRQQLVEFANTIPDAGSIELAAQPLTPDYRIAPIQESYDWPKIFDAIATKRGVPMITERYLVVFSSTRREDVPDDLITAVDFAAHQEAARSPALDFYGASALDKKRRGRSWCMWTDQASARAALSGPAHSLATRLPWEFYDSFEIELYNLRRAPDGHIEFEQVPHHIPEAAHEPTEARRNWDEIRQLVHSKLGDLATTGYAAS